MLELFSLRHFCIQFGILGSWMVGLPSVVKPFWKCTHRYSKKCLHGDSKSNQVGSEDWLLNGLLMMELSWDLWSQNKKSTAAMMSHVPGISMAEISQIPSKRHIHPLINGWINVSWMNMCLRGEWVLPAANQLPSEWMDSYFLNDKARLGCVNFPTLLRNSSWTDAADNSEVKPVNMCSNCLNV